MKVAIYGRVLQEQDVPYVRELISSLSSYEVEITKSTSTISFELKNNSNLLGK